MASTAPKPAGGGHSAPAAAFGAPAATSFTFGAHVAAPSPQRELSAPHFPAGGAEQLPHGGVPAAAQAAGVQWQPPPPPPLAYQPPPPPTQPVYQQQAAQQWQQPQPQHQQPDSQWQQQAQQLLPPPPAQQQWQQQTEAQQQWQQQTEAPQPQQWHNPQQHQQPQQQHRPSQAVPPLALAQPEIRPAADAPVSQPGRPKPPPIMTEAHPTPDRSTGRPGTSDAPAAAAPPMSSLAAAVHPAPAPAPDAVHRLSVTVEGARPLQPDRRLVTPIVRMHVVDPTTGDCVRVPRPHAAAPPAAAGASEGLLLPAEPVAPLDTRPYNLACDLRTQYAPRWGQELVLPLSLDAAVAADALLLLEVLQPVEAPPRSSALRRLTLGLGEPQEVQVAWGFLRLRGEAGPLTGPLSLKLYRYQGTRPPAAGGPVPPLPPPRSAPTTGPR
jgi:hypothetical protein